MDPRPVLTGYGHNALAILDVINMLMWKSRRQEKKTALTNQVSGGERSYTTKHQLAQHSNKIKKKRTISKEERKLFSKKKMSTYLTFSYSEDKNNEWTR